MSKVAISDRLPQQYDRGHMVRLLREMENQLHLLSTGESGAYYGSATAAPTTGTHNVGDWVKNSAPAAQGYFGWVCVTAGAPGTWKGFGVIQA